LVENSADQMVCLMEQMLDESGVDAMVEVLAAIMVAMTVELKGLIEAVVSDNVMAASKVCQ
jgi:hypothetical protein